MIYHITYIIHRKMCLHVRVIVVQQSILDGDGLGDAEGLGDVHHVIDELLRGGGGETVEDPVQADDVHRVFCLFVVGAG